MAKYKIGKMKEIYNEFPEDLKENLSMVRIFKYTDLDRIPKEHRKVLAVEFKRLEKEQMRFTKQILDRLSPNERKCVKALYEDFGYESDTLALDLENSDNQIEIAKDEIRRIKSEFDDYNKSKRKESNRRLEKLRSEVLMYCISREKIKFYYDAVSNSQKYGVRAIKIRNKIEKSQRREIAKIDQKIAKLTKIVNANPSQY